MKTLAWQLRGYRPPRFLIFMLGALCSAWILALWIVHLQPLQVIRECEGYRLRFGTEPDYKLTTTDFHCEFQAEGIRLRAIRPQSPKSI